MGLIKALMVFVVVLVNKLIALGFVLMNFHT